MAIVAALPFGLARLANAQDVIQEEGGPVIVGETEEWEGLRFEPFHFAFDLYGRVEENKISTLGVSRRESYKEIRATGSAWSRGYIGHPNFIELNLAGTFGLSQQFIDSESNNRHETPLESIDEYDVSANILPHSDYPTTIYSRRNHNYLTQQFGDTLDSLVTETGVQASLRETDFPTTLHYFHRTEEQSSNLSPTNFSIEQDTFEWLSTWRPAENQQLTWDYTLDSVTETGDLRPTNDFLRQHAIATHELTFGENDQHRLRSNFFGYNETGDTEYSRLRLDESLNLRHTPRFETLYNYSTDWSKYNGENSFFNRGSAGLRHKLFESLWTSFDVGASSLSLPEDNYTSDQYFTDLDLDYKKKVPYGELSASVGLGFDFQADSDRGSPISILNEGHVVPVNGIVEIQKQNVTPGSITVTDASGFIQYVEGIDYTLEYFPDRVEIRRILGGAISDGQALLVDYDIGPQPGADTTTWTMSSNVRYDFEEGFLRGVGLFARYLHQDQDRRSDDPDVIIPADVDDVTVGADYRLGYLLVSGEQQWHQSTLSPYDATRFNAHYRLPLGVGSTLDAFAGYDLVERTSENTSSTISTVKGRWTQRVDRNLSFAVIATWRNEHEDPGINIDAFEQRLEVTWKYRQTSVYGSIANSFVDSDTDYSTYLTVQLGLRREF
ncbi:MAG: hypothetical protein JNL80_13125 [Phycisphaerae bacterium]|nr:hypothetical protein [Phycisphaerae bacterium]